MDILLSQYSKNLFRLPVRFLSTLVLSLENKFLLLNAKTPFGKPYFVSLSPFCVRLFLSRRLSL